MRLVPSLTALAICALTAAAQAEEGDPIAAARQRFQLDCASCHGVDATGNGPVAGVLELTARQALLAHLEQPPARGLGKPGGQHVVVGRGSGRG